MVRESLSKLAPEWLPSKLADGKGPLSQADINRRHGYTDFDDLDLGGELGVGGFSTVRVATNRIAGALFAVKSAPHKPGHDPTSASGKDDADMLCDEARVLHMLCHASVIHCYGIAIFPKEVLMVLELMEGGELFERIVAKPTHHYTEAGARKAAYPENLLLRSDSSDHDFKIADFGLAVVLSRPGDVSGKRLVKEYAGTPGYVAPKSTRRLPEPPGYGAEADAWSCGAIIYALLGGYLPWPTRDMEKHKAQLRTKTVSFADASWEEVSPEATDLVRGLLDRDPYRRTKLAKALGAKWFEMDSNDLGRNTLYRCHVNFAQSLDQVNSLEERCTSGFGRHVHDAAEKEEVAVASARGFAVVRLATNRVTSATFAVKEAPHKPGHDPNRDPDDADMLADEAKILRSLCHDTVIHCYDVVVRPEQCFVVLQLMRGGELFDRIVGKPNHHYTENEARKAAYVLLNAVAFLSDHGVVHRDLKPENLLLADDANDHDFKIADFGLAAILTDERRRSTTAGTPGYAAPGSTTRATSTTSRATASRRTAGPAARSSSACSAATCRGPRDEEKMAANIRAQDVEFHAGYWDTASPEAKELIAGLLRRDPARRLSAAALDCAWFAMDDTVLEYNKLHDVHDTLSHTIGDAVFGCCAAGCGDAADAVYDMQAQARARR
ncbi:calmodulin-dependent protein kinase [Aureococcus anophagefferens]|nr:calmodulin-dependent protein kinase [Aureococcus anophagefferens]